METGPFTGHQQMSEAWMAFREFVRGNEDVPVGMLVRGGCKHDPGDEVIAAYEAPYIDGPSKAGARAFPLILPTTPEMPGAAEGKAVADALRDDERPTLVLWADSDPILPFSVGERVSSELELPAAAADRRRLALPPGGRRRGDRPRDRRVARLAQGAGAAVRLARSTSSIRSAWERSRSSWTRRGGSSSSSQVTVPGQ